MMMKLTDAQKKRISFLADMLKEIPEESITDKKRKDYRNRLKSNIKKYDEKIIQDLHKKFQSLTFAGAGAAGAGAGAASKKTLNDGDLAAVPVNKPSKSQSQRTRVSRSSNSDHNSNSNYSDTSNDSSDKKKPAKSNVINAIATAPETKYEHSQRQRHVSPPLAHHTESNHAPVAVEKKQQSNKSALEINANHDHVEIQLMSVPVLPTASKQSQSRPQSKSPKSKRNNVNVGNRNQGKENSDPHPHGHANGIVQGYKNNSNDDHKHNHNHNHNHEEKEMIRENGPNMGFQVHVDNTGGTSQLSPKPLVDNPNTNTRTNTKPISLSMPYTSPKEHDTRTQKQQQQQLQPAIHCPSIIDPHETNQVIPHNDFRYIYLERNKFEKEGYVQPPSCLSCSIILTNNKTTARPSDTTITTPNRHCKNRVMWLRDASIGLDPENWDGNLLYVTCAAAQAWMRNEAVDHWKWDAEKKVLYFI